MDTSYEHMLPLINQGKQLTLICGFMAVMSFSCVRLNNSIAIHIDL